MSMCGVPSEKLAGAGLRTWHPPGALPPDLPGADLPGPPSRAVAGGARHLVTHSGLRHCGPGRRRGSVGGPAGLWRDRLAAVRRPTRCGRAPGRLAQCGRIRYGRTQRGRDAAEVDRAPSGQFGPDQGGHGRPGRHSLDAMRGRPYCHYPPLSDL